MLSTRSRSGSVTSNCRTPRYSVGRFQRYRALPSGSATVMELTVESSAKGCRRRAIAAVFRDRTALETESAAWVAVAATRARSSIATRSRAVFSATVPRSRVPTSWYQASTPVTTATASTTTRKAAAAYFNLRLTAVTSIPAAFPRLYPSPYDFATEFTRRPFLGLPASRHAVGIDRTDRIIEDCPMDADISGRPLNFLEVTGRAATHVRDLAEPRCVVHVGVAAALIAMRNEARAAGIDLDVVSGFRDFNRQLAIWNGKFNGSRP